MEKILTTKEWFANQSSLLCYAWGCGLITLSSLVKIPFYPVPFTLQTLAIFILALTQSPKQAFGSSFTYLLCGTIGLPVFCGKANPLWMMGKCGGYLIAFPLAAYLTAKLVKDWEWPPLAAIFCGQAVIYTLGLLWLIPLFGWKIAITKGIIFFIPSDLIKNFIAVVITHVWKQRKQR